MDLPDDDVPLGLNIKAKIYRKEHRVKASLIGEVKKSSVPAPVDEFSKLAKKPHTFVPGLLDNLQKLEYNVPTPVQAQTIPIMLKHYNLIACAPTGSGKTAAYLLPILNEYIRIVDPPQECPRVTASKTEDSSIQPHKIQLFGLILAPTQELVRQIWSEAMRLSLGLSEKHFLACLKRKHYADRGKNKHSKAKSLGGIEGHPGVESKSSPLQKRVREFRLPRSTRILVATPCRMGTLLSLDASQCPFDLSRLAWLIIDECDKMLQIDLTRAGSNSSKKPRRPRSFRDQMAPIFSAFSAKSDSLIVNSTTPLVALFSATVPDEVRQWAREELSQFVSGSSDDGIAGRGRLIELFVGKRDSAVSTVSQELRYCATEEGKLLEMRCLLIRGLTYPCLVFMESRERAKELVKEILLSDSDVLANVISSDKTEAQRAAVIRAFREGQLNVLVCTDLLGRGIDFKGVSMVVNYDMPPSKEEYIHRVGRTGRAGHRGKAITLWTDADLPYMGGILKVIRRSGSEVDPELERLVNDWQKRRAKLLLGNRSKVDGEDLNVTSNMIISRRRGERRLLHEILHQNQSESSSHDGSRSNLIQKNS
ncbi:unnamed protein product [Echinostoma caproni]|uniref:RNA helicase n=1 Tax=Echinostoma caproni TaxID=27848 RepID=A0A183ALA3_9TREM|nr:unnamed protein product [Echinostoma caproni]